MNCNFNSLFWRFSSQLLLQSDCPFEVLLIILCLIEDGPGPIVIVVLVCTLLSSLGFFFHKIIITHFD